MDNRYLIVGVIMLLFVAVFGWQMTLHPEIQLTDISFSDITLSSVTADLTFSIKNPYLFGGMLDRLDLSVFGGEDRDRFLIGDIQKSSVFIPAMGTTTVSVPATIRTTGIGRSGLSLLFNQRLPVQVTGTAMMSVFGIPVPIPVNETRVVVREGLNVTLQ